MAINTQTITPIINETVKALRTLYPAITPVFMPYYTGQKEDTLETIFQEFSKSNAFISLKSLSRKMNTLQRLQFHGFASAKKNTVLGFLSQPEYLSLTSINISKYKNTVAFHFDFFCELWSQIHLFEKIMHQQNLKGFQAGIFSSKPQAEFSIRQALERDVFAALMTSCVHKNSLIHKIAKSYCEKVVAISNKGEYWNRPLPVVYEITSQIYKDRLKDKENKSFSEIIRLCLKYAKIITDEADRSILDGWVAFCKSAHIMSQQGHHNTTIISAAFYSSNDPFVKSICYLYNDLLKIDPEVISPPDISVYNVFLPPEALQENHDIVVQNTFDDLLNHADKDADRNIFFEKANQQNIDLVEGHIYGWCADALQSAGNSFEKALKLNSTSPEQAAKLDFEITKALTQLKQLKTLSSYIFEKRRECTVITVDEIMAICEDKLQLPQISKSLEMTIKDPNYQRELKKQRGLQQTYAPKQPEPAPQLTASAEPSPAFIPIGPAPAPGGMGPGSGGATVQTQTEIVENKE